MKGVIGMDDKMIIEAFFARNENAIQYLKDSYGAVCTKIASNILSDSRDVEECVDDAMLGMWNTIPPLRPNNLRAYLYTSVRNTAISKARGLKRDLPLCDELEEISMPDNCDDGYISDILSSFLRSLPKQHRIVFVKRYYYCSSIADIAKECGKSEGTVKSILSRTKEKLRIELTEKGVSI